MWFRNARVFRFTKPFDISAEELEEKLSSDAFKPCGPQETNRQGWVPPLGKHGEMLVHSANGYHLIALRKEEKILPGPVVKEAVGSLDKVKQIVTVNGFVNSESDFYGHPSVINGCSDLLVAIFGDKGIHSRTAMGAAALPLNVSVEINMVVEVED